MKPAEAAGIAFALGMIVGSVIFIEISYLCPMTDPAQRYLVEKGKAEYYLDSNNNRQWRLK